MRAEKCDGRHNRQQPLAPVAFRMWIHGTTVINVSRVTAVESLPLRFAWTRSR
jgi:hypothetical protein